MTSAGRRTVVTGMGVLTGSGRELPKLWEALIEGHSAARHITRFAAAGMPTRVAAELADFEPAQSLDVKSARRLDLCGIYGVAAAHSALQDAGVSVTELNPERVGIAVGTSLGGLGSTLISNDGFRERGYRGAGLAGLLNGHNGAASAEIACQLGVRGHAITLGSGSAPSNDAIGYAGDMIALERADVMIAGGAEAEAHHPLAPHPEGHGPRAAMQDALRRARRNPDSVGYVNAHGTATIANDAAESRAIQQHQAVRSRSTSIRRLTAASSITCAARHAAARSSWR